MRDWTHSRRLGTPADEAGYVVLRQPPRDVLGAVWSQGRGSLSSGERRKTRSIGEADVRRTGEENAARRGWCRVNLGLMGQQDRWQTGQGKSPKKSKIKRKITIKKRIKSTMKIKSRTSGTRPRNAGRPALPRVPALAPALALSPLPDLTLHLSLAPCGPLVNPPIED